MLIIPKTRPKNLKINQIQWRCSWQPIILEHLEWQAVTPTLLFVPMFFQLGKKWYKDESLQASKVQTLQIGNFDWKRRRNGGHEYGWSYHKGNFLRQWKNHRLSLICNPLMSISGSEWWISCISFGKTDSMHERLVLCRFYSLFAKFVHYFEKCNAKYWNFCAKISTFA